MSMMILQIRRVTVATICVCAALTALSTRAAEPQTVEQLVKSAVSGSTEVRYTAIDDLGERHEQAALAVPALTKLLQDSDPQIRWRAARTLGEYGELAKESAKGLRKQLADGDPIVQYHAAVALGKLEDPSDENVTALVDAATNKDSRVARAAISAIRNLKPGPKRVSEVLGKALKSNDKAVTLHALEAIVAEGANAAPFLKEALQNPDTAYLACTAIEQIGPDAAPTAPELAAILGKTKHSQLLIQTLLALASIGPAAESAGPQIAPLLSSDDTTVPVAAAYAIGSIGAKSADAELKKAAAKSDPFLQMMAVWALAKTHPDDQAAMKTAVEKITHELKNDNVGIRNAAAKSLQSLKAPPEMVAPQMVALINDPNPGVRANAIEAIASLGESVVPKLNNGLKNPQLRGAAIQVITKLGPKAGAAVPSLIETAKGASPELRTDIQFALAAIGPAAAPATDLLIESVGSKDTGERESALLALCKIGPGAKNATQRLTRVMQATDSFDAVASACALSHISPDDPKLTPLVVAKLTKGLSHPDEQTRLEAVSALAHMGAAAHSAAPALERAAKEDSSAEVRDAAAAALHPKSGH